jgi:hypothetical protein
MDGIPCASWRTQDFSMNEMGPASRRSLHAGPSHQARGFNRACLTTATTRSSCSPRSVTPRVNQSGGSSMFLRPQLIGTGKNQSNVHRVIAALSSRRLCLRMRGRHVRCCHRATYRVLTDGFALFGQYLSCSDPVVHGPTGNEVGCCRGRGADGLQP